MGRSPGFGSASRDSTRPVETRFPFGSAPWVLNLAAHGNSPDRSTKSTPSGLNALRLLVSAGFQVLFHSPPGVLFTFPSRYCSAIGRQLVFSLGRWSSLLPTGFLVPRGTLDTGHSAWPFAYGALTPCGAAFQPLPLGPASFPPVRNPAPQGAARLLAPGSAPRPGLGSSAFARHYLRNHFCFLLLRVLRCFSSPGLLLNLR